MVLDRKGFRAYYAQRLDGESWDWRK
uniref:Uncharacterized protein n=1 Tax=Rhizophora mucronata TaxID=61149 RepID=A0A2P2N8N9_RHIMU